MMGRETIRPFNLCFMAEARMDTKGIVASCPMRMAVVEMTRMFDLLTSSARDGQASGMAIGVNHIVGKGQTRKT